MLTPYSWVYRGETAEGYSEIDILENVDKSTANSHSFYTSEQCTVNYDVGEPIKSDDCHWELNAAGQQGCGVMAEEGTFNQAFNDNYQMIALQVEADTMKIWHFRKNEVPADLNSGNPDPSTWKTPSVALSPKSCNFKTAFSQFRVVCAKFTLPQQLLTNDRSSTLPSAVRGPAVTTTGTSSVQRRLAPIATRGWLTTLTTSKTHTLSSTLSSYSKRRR